MNLKTSDDEINFDFWWLDLNLTLLTVILARADTFRLIKDWKLILNKISWLCFQKKKNSKMYMLHVSCDVGITLILICIKNTINSYYYLIFISYFIFILKFSLSLQVQINGGVSYSSIVGVAKLNPTRLILFRFGLVIYPPIY